MDDYIVEARSDDFLHAQATASLSHLKADLSKKIDVCDLVKRTSIQTIFGVRRLTFEIIDDTEMDADDGMTVYARETVSIQVKDSVFRKAKLGDGRSRMTLAHEFGHAILHRGLILHRRTIETTRPAHIPPPRSAERQAKVFGARFLMPDSLVENCLSSTDIVNRCGVSQKAADIRFSELNLVHRRRDFANKMRALARELKKNNEDQILPEFLSDPCPSCGQFSIKAIGCKYMCMCCDNVSDRFQDGD